MTTKPRVLIEDWLPIEELGIESRRENAAKSALPPLNFLHIWWARRPIVASTAVVLAGLLPGWTPDLAAAHPEAKQVATEASYKAWLLHLVGIWGDAVAGRNAVNAAKAASVRLPGNVYGYKQAFRNAVSRQDIDLLHSILRDTWGKTCLLSLIRRPVAERSRGPQQGWASRCNYSGPWLDADHDSDAVIQSH